MVYRELYIKPSCFPSLPISRTFPLGMTNTRSCAANARDVHCVMWGPPKMSSPYPFFLPSFHIPIITSSPLDSLSSLGNKVSTPQLKNCEDLKAWWFELKVLWIWGCKIQIRGWKVWICELKVWYSSWMPFQLKFYLLSNQLWNFQKLSVGAFYWKVQKKLSKSRGRNPKTFNWAAFEIGSFQMQTFQKLNKKTLNSCWTFQSGALFHSDFPLQTFNLNQHFQFRRHAHHPDHTLLWMLSEHNSSRRVRTCSIVFSLLRVALPLRTCLDQRKSGGKVEELYSKGI